MSPAPPAVVLVDCSRCREPEVLDNLLAQGLEVPVVRVTGKDLPSLGVSLDLETGIAQVSTDPTDRGVGPPHLESERIRE